MDNSIRFERCAPTWVARRTGWKANRSLSVRATDPAFAKQVSTSKDRPRGRSNATSFALQTTVRWRLTRVGSCSRSWVNGRRRMGRLSRFELRPGIHDFSSSEQRYVRTNVSQRVHSKHAGLEVDFPSSGPDGSAQPNRRHADQRVLALAPGVDPVERHCPVLYLV